MRCLRLSNIRGGYLFQAALKGLFKNERELLLFYLILYMESSSYKKKKKAFGIYILFKFKN